MTTNIRAASAKEADQLLSRACKLLECRPAPTPSYPDMMVDWPVEPLVARLFIGGLQIPSFEHGQKDAAVFDAMLQAHAPSGAGIWSLGAQSNGVFIGRHPFEDVRNWFVQELVLTPCVILSLDTDLIVVADDQLRYSVVGAPRSVIDSLDEKFGGAANFRERLVNSIDAGEIGFGAEDVKWAKTFLLRWCFGQTSSE